ncbi:chitobiase/beta-hexosaminidase C-terminal domain-containing protein [Paenibacillus sp. GCM10027627]|uniref:chitobiase/beta-hexosaminidase C-terminal domain-containing protein n=1 Tax=unclassified Paenibacillus TaxID=185978 RepID=UPI00362A49E4
MVMKQKSIYAIGFAIFMAVVLIAGGLSIKADSSKWTSHADTSWYDALLPSYTIDTPAKLAGVAKLVNEDVAPDGKTVDGFRDKRFDISGDLDLSAYLWEPIGTPEKPFKGTLFSKDGAIYTISGMKLPAQATYAGLVGVMDGGTLGGLIFAASGEISLHNSWQDVHAGAAVGKMINNSTIYDITSYLPVQVGSSNATVYAGGIVGAADGKIANTFNHAAVTANGSSVYAGGIAGYSEGTSLAVKKAGNFGAITANGFDSKGSVHAGGITGYSSSSLFMDDETTPIDNEGAIAATGGAKSYAGGILGKAASEVKFSATTSNKGNVSVNAPEASGSYAGGLAGSIAAQQNDVFAAGLTGAGTVENIGGTNVYTGGLFGYVGGSLTWSNEIVNAKAVVASGKEKVYSGGLIGYATGDIIFPGGAKNTAGITVTGGANEAYTGGLIGYAGQRILLDNAAAGAYENSGAIHVEGGVAVITGGIAANAAYSTSAGQPNLSVRSTGDISVEGTSLLQTGGFIGKAESGGPISEAYFGKSITVVAGGASAEEPVLTGGIIGYGSGVQVTNSGFTGKLDVSGSDRAYTGGIAGQFRSGTITGAKSGNTKEQYALIAASGVAGGIVGKLDGAVTASSAHELTVTLRSSQGAAGGIAGQAAGEISGALVGNPLHTGTDSLRIEGALGVNGVMAGGIVGRNEGVLAIASSRVTKIDLATDEAGNGFTLGAVAGSLTAEAKAGTADAPLEVSDVTLTVESDDSKVGGAIGLNKATELYLSVSSLALILNGDNVQAGGAAGINEASIGAGTSGITVKDSSFSTTGSGVSVGGMYGVNQGQSPSGLVQNATIVAEGANSSLGGIAGLNRGSISGGKAINAALEAKGSGANAGGIVGLSEPGEGTGASAIANVEVVAEEAQLLKVLAPDANGGGIVGFAKGTEISNPAITAEEPYYAVLSIQSERAAAGGIAGRMERGKIIGDTIKKNVVNLMIATTAAASNAYAGGIVGYNDEARLEGTAGEGVNLLLSGSHAVAGGTAGYNRGSETAVVSNVFVSGLHIKSNVSAASSVIGGIVGINDRRESDTGSVASPDKAVSSIQKSRFVGAGSSSKVIDSLSPSTVVGGLIGDNRSLVANNSIADKLPLSVKGEGSVIGGLVGVNKDSGTLYYTYSNTNLGIEGKDTLAGGLVGDNAGHVLSSYVEIDVTGKATGTAAKSAALGGLIGKNSGTVEKSYTSSKVTATGAYSHAGGLVGEQVSGTIANSYVVKEVQATNQHSFAGGLLGRITGGKVTNVYSAAAVKASGGAAAGGFAGRYDSGSKELLYKSYYVSDEANGMNQDLPDFAEGKHHWQNSSSRLATVTVEELKDRSAFPAQSGWDFEQVWKYGSKGAQFQYPELIRTANSGGDNGSEVNANINWYINSPDEIGYDLRSESELAGLAAIVNGTIPGLAPFDFAGREIRIANPIHIQSSQWEPIGAKEETPFQGDFSGGGYLIDGLTVVADHEYSGLFGVIGEQGAVSQVALEPIAVSGKKYTGVLAGLNKGEVSAIDIKLLDGVVVSGGIVGSFLGGNKGTFESVNVSVEDESRIEAAYEGSIAGGFIGENELALKPELFQYQVVNGSVGSDAKNAVVGGLIGAQKADATDLHTAIEKKYAIGAEGAGSIVGGLIGHYEKGAAVNMTVTFKDGQLEAPGADSTLGGLIGYSGADNTIRSVLVTAEGAGGQAQQLKGNGAVGGIVGAKLGSASASYDMEQAVVDKIVLSAYDDKSEAVIGGIAGKLSHTAVKDMTFKAHVKALGGSVTAGGIVGHASDSILRQVDATTNVSVESKTGDTTVGGIAGVLESNDRDNPFDFGLWAPLYYGIYDSKAHSGLIVAKAAPNAALFGGGIVGQNKSASIYQSHVSSSLSAAGGRDIYAGGVAGYNDGILVRLTAQNQVEASGGTSYHVGGIVGKSDGGGIHFTKLIASAGGKLKVGGSVAKAGVVPSTMAGGFIGSGSATEITHSSTNIPVEVVCTNADNAIYGGGFAGLLGEQDGTESAVTDAFSNGSVTVKGTGFASVGGFVGSVNQYRISDAYTSGLVFTTALDAHSGGFAGTVEKEGELDNVIVTGQKLEAASVKPTVLSYNGGIAGYSDGTITNSYTAISVIQSTATGSKAHNGALAGYQFRNGKLVNNVHAATLNAAGFLSGSAQGNRKAVIENPLLAGDWDYEYDTYFLTGPNDGKVVIGTLRQLRGTILLYNRSTGLDYYKLYNRSATEKLPMPNLILAADLDLTGFRLTPFDHFSDSFDGGGHTIKGFVLKTAETEEGPAGFFAENDGTITRLNFIQADLSGGMSTGIVTGINREEGIIDEVGVSGVVKGQVHFGGIAGVNDGLIDRSYARGTISELKENGTATAGGIAGINNGEIAQSFSYASVVLRGANVTAGGIAGQNSGDIVNSYNTGLVLADGKVEARAGGIAGYAEDGLIGHSYSAAEVAAGFAGDIIPGKAYFGGIAGQKSAAAVITNNVFNWQMLKRNTAYYDADGKRIAGVSNGALGVTASQLANGTLPGGLNGNQWVAAEGLYPRLTVSNGSTASILSAAAVLLKPNDLIYRIEGSFGLTKYANLAWTADPGKIAISAWGAQMSGTLFAQGEAELTASLNGEKRSIRIQVPVWKFKETALPPSVVPGDKSFKDELSVTLQTAEPDGVIYYTLDGSRPSEHSFKYVGPIVLKATTTIKAVTLVDAKEESVLFADTWIKQSSGGGGGGFIPPTGPITPTPGITAIAGVSEVGGQSEPVTVAKNSKLTLKGPEGQMIYYTTDGSTPTKNSPVFNGELIISSSMTIKAITDLDSKVITMHFVVENAKFEWQDNAASIAYISGYRDGTFKPDQAMTRLELVQSLYPLLKKEEVNLGNVFSDVGASEREAVAFFASAGIIDGYPNGTFGGGKGVSRAEFTVILSRILNLELKNDGKPLFKDVAAHWAKNYINAFAASKYVKGFPDGSFRPEDEISRAEAVAVINRIIGAKPQSEGAKFTDLTPDHWAYGEIMAAAE